MGSSTGNMLVDNPDTLEAIFSKAPVLIATHCEEESIILANTAMARERFGDELPFEMHPQIRSREACITPVSYTHLPPASTFCVMFQV